MKHRVDFSLFNRRENNKHMMKHRADFSWFNQSEYNKHMKHRVDFSWFNRRENNKHMKHRVNFLEAELAWLTDLQRTAYPHKWSPISWRLSAGQGKFAGQRPTFYHCATLYMWHSKQHVTHNAPVNQSLL